MDFKCVEERAGIKATLLCIIYTYIRHKVNRFPLFADVVSCFDHLFLLPLISSKVAATAASNPLLSKLRLSLSEVSRCIKSTQTVILKAVFLFTFAPHSSLRNFAVVSMFAWLQAAASNEMSHNMSGGDILTASWCCTFYFGSGP